MNEAIIGLVGVLVGSFITVLKDSWTSYRERRREGSYSAIRLISILEAYADNCIDVVQDDGTIDGQPAGRHSDGEDYLEAQVATPAPLDYPEDIAWRSLDEQLMHRILALPNKARRTNRYIAVASDFAFPPHFEEYFDARQEGYARLGQETLKIASDLRTHFGVSANSDIQMASEWNPETYLGNKVDEIERAKADMEERRLQKRELASD